MLVTLHNASLITDILRKIVRKNVHATILKHNMGYDQDAIPGTVVAVKSFIVACL